MLCARQPWSSFKPYHRCGVARERAPAQGCPGDVGSLVPPVFMFSAQGSQCCVPGRHSRQLPSDVKFTFTAAGSYGYHCAAHCAQYEGGRVVVK
jgi:hypothetical protein